jgi:hypothetical protein
MILDDRHGRCFLELENQKQTANSTFSTLLPNAAGRDPEL